MTKTERCESANGKIEHSDDLAYFTVRTVRGSELVKRTYCLSHAAGAQERGLSVELIDER